MNRFRLRQDTWINPDIEIAGRINRKFQRSFDAELNKKLIHFTAESFDLHPLSCLIPQIFITDSKEGDDILFRDQNLIINGTYLSQDRAVRIPVFFAINHRNIEANLKKLELYLQKSGLDSEINRIMNGETSEYFSLSDINSGLSKDEIYLSYFRNLIGVGEGLTPAGDDFISGVLLVDRHLKRNKFIIEATDFEFIEKKTTQQSVMQLKFAAEGKLSIRFEHFLAKLLQAHIDEKDFLKCIEHGHSSGSDILWGVYSYLKSAGFELK